MGLTEVSRGEGCDLEFSGVAGFVWWATQANSQDEFLEKLTKALGYYKLVLIEASKIRRFEEKDDVSDEFHETVEHVRQNENWTCFMTFYSYPHHTA